MYLFRNNLVPVIEDIHRNLGFPAKKVATFFAHTLKNIEGKYNRHPNFSYRRIYDLFEFISKENLTLNLSRHMLPIVYQYPNMDFQSILNTLKFKRRKEEDLLAPVEFLYEKFKEIRKTNDPQNAINWLMGQLHRQAVGNMSMKDLRAGIEKKIKNL